MAAYEHSAPLSELLRHVAVVKFRAHFNFDLVFTTLERAQSRMSAVHLVNPWGRLPMVERYLEHRMEEGCPLEVLRIDAPIATLLDEHYNITDLELHIL